VTVEPDFSDPAGPHDEVDDEAKSTSNCDSSEQLMGSITTDTTLSEYGTSLGSFTLNGTMGELNAVSDRMSDITRMAGSYEAGVTVATNTAILHCGFWRIGDHHMESTNVGARRNCPRMITR
jgi:hypothetical protein